MSGPASSNTLVAAIPGQFACGHVTRTGNRTAEFFGALIQRRALFSGKMLVNQIAHDRCLRTAKSLRLFLQESNVSAIHFQRNCFHAPRVFLSWQTVNTEKPD